MSEIPVHLRPRRLADWINPTGAKKVHSLIDKVYKRKNLEMAWERVRANRGSGGVDGQSLADFEAQVDSQLDPPAYSSTNAIPSGFISMNMVRQ